MLSLARSSLRHETQRYVPAVLAVSFAGLLLLVQIGLLLGLFRTVTAVIDRSHADLWITSPGVESFDQGADFPARVELQRAAAPGVEQTEQVRMFSADVLTPRGNKLSATVIGYDLAPGGFVMPDEFRPGLARAMGTPDGVVIDAADRSKLGATLGTVLEVNGHRAVVVGMTGHFRSIGGVYLFTSLHSSNVMLRREGEIPETTTFVAARIGAPARAEQVRDGFRRRFPEGKFSVWTGRELSLRSQWYWAFETGMGIGVIFFAVIGVVVGMVITSQTLRGVILASLREYAALRAMGVPLASLRLIVLELAAWIGTLGLLCTAVVACGVAAVASWANVGLYIPWWTIVLTITFTFAVSLASGFVALRALYSAEPAELLR